MRSLILMACLLVSVTGYGQQQHSLKHAYKVRLRTLDNKLQRGIITIINDSLVSIAWHDSVYSHHYSDIARIKVWRKGTVGRWLLLTLPVNITAGQLISHNQPRKYQLTRSINDLVAFEAGLTAGIIQAAAIGHIKRRTYRMAGNKMQFQRFVDAVVVKTANK